MSDLEAIETQAAASLQRGLEAAARVLSNLEGRARIEWAMDEAERALFEFRMDPNVDTRDTYRMRAELFWRLMGRRY